LNEFIVIICRIVFLFRNLSWVECVYEDGLLRNGEYMLKMMSRNRFFLAFFLCCLGWVDVHAQNVVVRPEPAAAPDGWVRSLERDFRTFLYYMKPLDYVPISLAIEQNVFYDDNVQLAPAGQPLTPGTSRGDFLSSTNLNGSMKFPVGSQTFFVSGGYNMQRYAYNKIFNSNNYHVDGGMNWSIGNRCFGDIVGATATYQSPFIQQNVINQINLITQISGTASARCHIGGQIYGFANGGWRQYTNTALELQTNNRDQTFETVGLEYNHSPLDRFGVSATFVRRQFTTRSATDTGQLAQGIDQQNYLFNYERTISSKILISGTAGVAAVQGRFPTYTISDSFPIYSVDFRWLLTPKLSLNFSSARMITAPQGMVSNAQEEERQSLNVGYKISPRLSLEAFVSRMKFNNNVLGTTPESNFAFQQQRIWVGGFLATYYVSPYLQLLASYTYTNRLDTVQGYDAISNRFMFGLSYHGSDFYINHGKATVID